MPRKTSASTVNNSYGVGFMFYLQIVFIEPSRWRQKVMQMLFSGSSSDTQGTSTGMRINRLREQTTFLLSSPFPFAGKGAGG